MKRWVSWAVVVIAALVVLALIVHAAQSPPPNPCQVSAIYTNPNCP